MTVFTGPYKCITHTVVGLYLAPRTQWLTNAPVISTLTALCGTWVQPSGECLPYCRHRQTMFLEVNNYNITKVFSWICLMSDMLNVKMCVRTRIPAWCSSQQSQTIFLFVLSHKSLRKLHWPKQHTRKSQWAQSMSWVIMGCVMVMCLM